MVEADASSAMTDVSGGEEEPFDDPLGDSEFVRWYRFEKAKEKFVQLALARADCNDIAADALHLWAERMKHADAEFPMPTELEAHLVSPDWPELASRRFRHSCTIHPSEPPKARPTPPPSAR